MLVIGDYYRGLRDVTANQRTVRCAAVAGCVAYFNKYRDFQKSLDEDFNDFEEETEASNTETTNEEKEEPVSPVKREYVSIPLDTPENPNPAEAETKTETETEDFLDDDFDIDSDSSEAEV